MINYYAIKTKSIKAFNLPFIAMDDKEAIIKIRNVLYSDDSNELAQNRGDYSLFCVGGFNNERGTFSGRPRYVIDLDSIPVIKKIIKEEKIDEV